MKIEIDDNLLFELMQTGQINAHQLQCLDHDSKQQVRNFCLQLCKQESCQHCQWREHCHSNKIEQAIPISLLKRSVNTIN
ncbi:hypothetical protein [Thiomicrorhabdus sediminis]|uniref:Uncharacterized protein n=1 Tax=Thiomicrorhabdus sediminis TaxID=2580412 RepID=A0A4P9K6J7_9GAMM|nr:hypothetical protein [Thiomicrorhabdus sediminis]QCU90080.1 hypothetical protein FE785_05250 [Thiomicrorhabdus sediminis]